MLRTERVFGFTQREVRFLCSEQADYITGTNLKVDGGFGISQRVPGLHDPVKVPT